MTTNGSRIGSQWRQWGATDRLVVQVHPKHRQRFYVYVAWGRGRTRPLYVGKSNGFWDRIGRHIRSAPWAAKVVEFEAFAFSSERAALEGELEAIQALNPIYNVKRGLSRREQARIDAAWKVLQERKRREREDAKAKAAERRARWAARMAELAAHPKQPAAPRPRAARVQSPWQGRQRRRVIADYRDFPADQLEIIRRVQNHEGAA